MSRLETLRVLMGAPELHAGLLWGAAAAALILLAAWAPPLRGRRPLPVADGAMALAALAALYQTRTTPVLLVAGVVTLCVTGAVIGAPNAVAQENISLPSSGTTYSCPSSPP